MMLQGSLVRRRLLQSAARAFSSTAVAVPSDSSVLEELQEGKTQEFIQSYEKEFADFNALADSQLKEMNQTRITNIIERGGIEGWNVVMSPSLIFLRPLISPT